jgi:hypothetical protein
LSSANRKGTAPAAARFWAKPGKRSLSALSAAEKTMGVTRLGCPGSVGCIERKGIALQHRDVFKIIGKGARG